MPVYRTGSKCFGQREKEAEWLRFHAPQAPGNFHCAPTVTVIGLLFGGLASWRRTLRVGMVAHAWADVWSGWLSHIVLR